KSPYSLYAISNVGSLLGLMSYPFFVEPVFSLREQGTFWSQSFLVVCILLIVCSGYLMLLHRKKPVDEQTANFTHARQKQILLWFVLPAISSMMLLAATNQ